jgi:lipid-binding SYLF domain-containing protein
MNASRRSVVKGAAALAGMTLPLTALSAHASNRRDLTADSLRALDKLEGHDPRAKSLAGRARGVLVFPSIVKAGLVFGGETGDGTLLHNGHAERFYNISGASWGLQIGGEAFSLALFFMKESALDYLRKSAGFSLGTGPSIVVVSKGAGAEANTTTLTHDVYAFAFGQKGLMADLTIEGKKITPIHPS